MAFFDVYKGTEPGTVLAVTGEQTVGREADNSVHLPDSRISRHHAAIRPLDRYVTVVDLGSANGTFVNGRRLHQFVPQPLYEGDEVGIGDYRFVFHSEGRDPDQSRMRASRPTIMVPGVAGRQVPAGTLSMVMLKDDPAAHAVHATIDASRDMLDPGAAGRDHTGPAPAELLRRSRAMVRIAANLGTVTRIRELLDEIMRNIFDMFPRADRAFIMLRDRATGELAPVTGRKRSEADGSAPEQFPVSRTIISAVVDRKQSVLLQDALGDERFKAQLSVVSLSIRSLMCAPFICKGELLGLISADTVSPSHRFSPDDLALLTAVASQAAIAIKNAELYEEVAKETRLRTQLARYLSPDVVEGVVDGTIPLQLGGERKQGTLMFCDIVGFTRMAENMTAVETINNLNRSYEVITRIVTHNNGTLHKFEGDMVMAFWNVLFPDAMAEVNAIRASVEMQAALWVFNLEFERERRHPVHIGIGCHTGEFAGGNIGGADRMEYTVIGDSVNLAKRIETLAGRWQVFVSGETYLPARELCCAVELPPATVRGRTAPVRVYSIRGISDGKGTLLLNIPVNIVTPDGSPAGSGMLVRCETARPSGAVLFLATAVNIGSWESLLLHLDMPELSAVVRLKAGVAGAERVVSGNRTDYWSVSLVNISGDPEALSFVRPGSLCATARQWNQMKRQ